MIRTFKDRQLYGNDFKFAITQEYLGGDLSFSDFCKKKSLDRSTKPLAARTLLSVKTP
jgi:hypothetical protein